MQTKSFDESDSIYSTSLNASAICNANNTTLVPISEEENSMPLKEQIKLKITYDNVNRMNSNQSDSGRITHQNIPKIVPSLSKNYVFMKISFL